MAIIILCVSILYTRYYTRYVIIHAVQDFRSRLYMVPKYAWRVQHAASSSFDVIDGLRLRTHIIGTYIRNIMDDMRKYGMETESTVIQQRFLRHYNIRYTYVECIYNASTIYPGLASFTVIAVGTNDDFCVTKSMWTHCCYYIYYIIIIPSLLSSTTTRYYIPPRRCRRRPWVSRYECCSAFTRGALYPIRTTRSKPVGRRRIILHAFNNEQRD